MKKLQIIFFALFCACFLPVLAYAQVQVAPYVNSNVQLFDNLGEPCAGCLLSTFAAGTSTPLATYSDSGGTVANSNPIQLDSAGRATIYLTSASYKFVLKSALSVTIWTQDNITWNNLASSLTSLTVTGTVQVIPSTAATSGANQSGPLSEFCANIWNGSASVADCWKLQDVVGTGSNPTSTLTMTHSGSSGTSSINLGSFAISAGAVTATSVNGEQVVGQGTNTTIAAAVTAAGTTGSVVIPASYTGTDNAQCNSVPCIDFRQNTNAAVGFYHGVRSTFPSQSSGSLIYPGGHDFPVVTFGPADIHLTNGQIDCTSSTSVAAGTTTITVGTCADGSGNGGPSGTTAVLSHASGVTLVLEPGTANEETVSNANWSIVDGTHLSVTTTLSHTQPYTVRQQGTLIADGRAFFYNAPSGTIFYPIGIATGGQFVLELPTDTGATFPNNAVNFVTKITGSNGASKNLLFQNNNSSSATKISTSTGSQIIDAEDAAFNLVCPGACIIFGNKGGTGTSGSWHFRNNQTDQTEEVTINTANGNVTSIGQFISSVATGTAPLSVTSTTNVAKLNASILTGSGTAATLSGTGACATITTQTGGAIAGRATCTGTTGASTLTITPGLTAPNGWVCSVQDQTTRANLLQQTSTTSTACTLTATSVTQNDVFVFTAIAF